MLSADKLSIKKKRFCFCTMCISTSCNRTFAWFQKVLLDRRSNASLKTSAVLSPTAKPWKKIWQRQGEKKKNVPKCHNVKCKKRLLEKRNPDYSTFFNALTAVGALMTLIDFTLSNARRFYSSMGNPLAVKGLMKDHRRRSRVETGPSQCQLLVIPVTFNSCHWQFCNYTILSGSRWFSLVLLPLKHSSNIILCQFIGKITFLLFFFKWTSP